MTTPRSTSAAAVIFDFDGVLANSEPLHLSGFQLALATRGLSVPPDDYYAFFLGYSDEDALTAMAGRYGWGLSTIEVDDLVGIKTHHMTELLAVPAVLFPGAADCVRRLSRVLPLAIASGAKRHEIELVLRANDLTDHFRAIVASGETPRSKPSPDPYARAFELLTSAGAVHPGTDAPARCIAVEDSVWGIQSAKAAGLRCIGLPTSYPADELREADLVIDGLDDLTIECLTGIVQGSS